MILSNTLAAGHYKPHFEELCSGEQLFMKVLPDDLPNTLLPKISRDASGLLVFEFPLMEALGGTPQDITYVLGTDIVADSEAHRDLIASNSLNCHYTVRGSMDAEGAIVSDELHDDGGGLNVPLYEATAASAIEKIHAEEGDIYLFFGGRVTHEFTSGPAGRFSAMRHYVFDL